MKLIIDISDYNIDDIQNGSIACGQILKAVKKAVKNGKLYEERPQGEWARHDEWRDGEYIGGFYHVNCPCEDDYYSKWRTNFCPNCGLPMQKGGAV